jgi:general secretion pathway protein G
MEEKQRLTIRKSSFVITIPVLRKKQKCKIHSGFTIIELLLIVAIIATLLVVAMPGFQRMFERAKTSQACADIATMGTKISDHFMDYGQYPETLEELDFPKLHDPYGFAYEYLVIFGKDKGEISGKWRKDRFLVPLNYDFDLYSIGKDGKTTAPLTAASSYDDIIRANNGRFIDIASKY